MEGSEKCIEGEPRNVKASLEPAVCEFVACWSELSSDFKLALDANTLMIPHFTDGPARKVQKCVAPRNLTCFPADGPGPSASSDSPAAPTLPDNWYWHARVDDWSQSRPSD